MAAHVPCCPHGYRTIPGRTPGQLSAIIVTETCSWKDCLDCWPERTMALAAETCTSNDRGPAAGGGCSTACVRPGPETGPPEAPPPLRGNGESASNQAATTRKVSKRPPRTIL
jgi:hypothetical protein